MKKYLSFLFAVMSVNFMMAAGIDKKEMYLEGSQGKLFTIVEYPEQVQENVGYPLVILCHGFNGNCENPLWDTLSNDILAKGMAVLRFDFNGHGKSEGLFQNMTVPNEIEDLKKVIEWAQDQKWVSSISLVGHSQGGVVVSMTAGELGDKVIKSEVLMAPAAVLRDDALRGNTMGALYDPWNLQTDYVELPKFQEGQTLLLGRNYIETALTLPIYETASRYNGPVLILHGSCDRVVPYTYGVTYDRELSNSKFRLIEGEDHGFSKTMKESCLEVADWLEKELKPAPVNPVRI